MSRFEIITSIISALALICSIYSILHTKKREKDNIQLKEALEIETKLDFIIANTSGYTPFIAYRFNTLQGDLLRFCKKYNLNSEMVLDYFSRIYLPLSNDGEDVVLSFDDITQNASLLIQIIKNA